MKRLFLVAMLFSGYAATAQEQLVKTYNYYRTDTTGKDYFSPKSNINPRGLLPQATFSHNTSRGKIYTLPIDNMPCLVPDMKQVATMPGQYSMPEGRMPNAIPRQRIIPDEKEKEKKDK